MEPLCESDTRRKCGISHLRTSKNFSNLNEVGVLALYLDSRHLGYPLTEVVLISELRCTSSVYKI